MFLQVDGAADSVRFPIIACILIALGACFFHSATAHAEDDLITAARTGNIALAKKSVRRGGDVNMVGQYGRVALHIAAVNNHPEMVAFLIEAGADVNKHEKDEEPPLIAMVSRGNAGISRLLLEAGANLTVTKGKWNDPISILADWSNPELAELLKSYDVDINATNALGDTVAHRQTRDMLRKLNSFDLKLIVDPSYDKTNDLEEALRIYRGFFEAGADPNVRNKAGQTPLIILAGRTKDPEASRVLLDAGADPNIRDNEGKTAMDLASGGGATALMALLADSGSNPNADPLILFKALFEEDRLRLLLEAGADPNAVGEICKARYGLRVECDERYPGTPESHHILHYAISSMYWSVESEKDKESVQRNLRIIRILLEAGSDPNTGAPKNALWLALANLHRNTDLVRLLLEFGATLEGIESLPDNRAGNRYLPHAPYQLGRYRADAYSDEKRRTKRGIVIAWLESGADPNDAHPETGMTPLRIAVQRGEIGIVRALINAGANVAGDNVDGMSILDAAIKSYDHNRKYPKAVCSGPSAKCEKNERFVNAKQFVKDGRTIIAELVKAGASAKTTVGEEIRRLVGRGTALARLVDSDKDYSAMIKEFDKARKAEPLWPPIYYRLGVVEAAAGNHPQALEYFEIYLALAPGSKNARDVRDKIYELEVLAERFVSGRDAIGIMLEISRSGAAWKSNGKGSPRTSHVSFSHSDKGTVHNFLNGLRNQKNQSRVRIDGNTFRWGMTYYYCDAPQEMPHGCPIRATNECTVVSPNRVVCKGHEHWDFAEANGQAQDYTWEYNRY